MDAGEKFVLSDGREVTILPLTLGAKRRLDQSGAWAQLEAPDEPVREAAVVRIVMEVLKRAHPDLTSEVVEDMVDAPMARRFLDAVTRVNGGRKAEPGEAPSP